MTTSDPHHPEADHKGASSPDLITSKLRQLSADHHRQAEGSTFQRLLVSGQLGRELHLEWLRQMYLLHQALELELARCFAPAQSDSGFDPRMWEKTGQLKLDLVYWGETGMSFQPLPAVVEFSDAMSRWAVACPTALLGAFYVLEGSTNGGRFIARALRQAWRLNEGEGVAYLDPYGDQQATRWQECKLLLDRCIPPATHAVAVEAALFTFSTVTALGAQLLGERPDPEKAD